MAVKADSTKHLRHQDSGEFLGFEQTTSGLRGQTSHCYFQATLFNSGIIRIQIASEDNFDELSYAVVSSPEPTSFEVRESEKAITLETSSIQVKIQKEPLRFGFYDSTGNLLNEDHSGFGVSFMGEAKSVYKTLQKGERFIGLGEKTGNLDRRGAGYTNHNTDSFAYSSETDPLYCTIPFFIGLHHLLAYGIFVDNSYQSHFNFGASNDQFSSFTVEGGDMNYYFIQGNSVADIITSYTQLTGRMDMPPLWGLGYQQCRYSYYPDLEVNNVARTFREKKIPADAIVLDIHYMDNYKIFSWDSSRFPNPTQMIGHLKDQGFNVVLMCDPGIKIDKNYQAYQEGISKDLFLKYPDGTNYSGQVWPGWCHFPDFTNPKTRSWWMEQLEEYTRLGVNGYWNDMNEIATWGQKLPELIEFDFEGDGGSSKRGRNVYGLMMSKATFEGAKKHLDNQRPFNLTRSAYSGVQRYSAVWTGDNVSTDEHMLLGVRLVNSLGLGGVAYAGYDVGGFVGEPSTGLFARWISIGAFSPFFRGHSMINSRDSEPWSFGEEVEDISRNYINLRYQLIPYIYSTFYEASISGIPVCRSLAIDHSFEDEVYNHAYQNQYLFGPGIMVAPIESYKEVTKVYLPKGRWYDFHNETLYRGESHIYVDAPLTHLPLFVKAGSVIPMQSIVQSMQEDPEPIMYLHVYLGDSGEFLYYEDDGSSYQYQNGARYLRKIVLNHLNDTLVLEEAKGSWESKFSEIKLCFHGFEEVDSLIIGDQQHQFEEEELVFLPAISNFDPLGQPIIEQKISIATLTIVNAQEEICIRFNPSLSKEKPNRSK